MNLRCLPVFCTAMICIGGAGNAFADSKIDAVKLSYIEVEQGIDPYRVTVTVADEVVRIDDESDDGGYIIYDMTKDTIYSITHFNRSMLVIPKHQAEEFKPAFKVDIEYRALEDAPRIAGRAVYNYTVKVLSGETDATCVDIQLVPGLMPDVARTLRAFRQVVSANLVSKLDNTPVEFRTPCYLVGQVYNEGAYYSKGLPIQEWYSDGRRRQLLNYENVEVDESIFDLPAEYRQYSVDTVE